MSEKAFTMTSNQYCGSCGSFDLVMNNPDWMSRRILGLKSVLHCHGCDDKFHEEEFSNNAIRTTPLTVDDFFFQTNLRNQQLRKRQIQPLTQALGFSLIACAITGLFLVKLPNDFKKSDNLKIEWANESSKTKDTNVVGVVKALQLEFDKMVKAK